MAETLRGGLSLGLSGFGFWSHDISGFENTAPPDVYKRWVAFGLLSSHSRLHGNSSYRVPWLFDEEAVDVLRHFTELKCRLMPYLWAKAVEASERGLPMMRGMVLEFPEDPGCAYLDRQYMLGDSLLVAPIFNSEGRAEYYLPSGRWTNFLDGRVVEGGRWVSETHGFMGLPLMVRPGAVIPVGAVSDRTDYDFGKDLVWHVFDFPEGMDVRSSAGRSSVLEIKRTGPVYEVRQENPSGEGRVLFRNHRAADFTSSAEVADTASGAEVRVPSSGILRISLK
jgi:alpha-D-xyloside xylohydrolase